MKDSPCIPPVPDAVLLEVGRDSYRAVKKFIDTACAGLTDIHCGLCYQPKRHAFYMETSPSLFAGDPAYVPKVVTHLRGKGINAKAYSVKQDALVWPYTINQAIFKGFPIEMARLAQSLAGFDINIPADSPFHKSFQFRGGGKARSVTNSFRLDAKTKTATFLFTFDETQDALSACHGVIMADFGEIRGLPYISSGDVYPV